MAGRHDDIINTITRVAQKHGVDPALALAVAWQESKWNTRAIGDNGTSFGLYQLHRGGQLGNRTPEWAYNPENNANQALSVMAGVARKHPKWSPGEIAVASQRPAYEVRPEYISNVNRWVPQIRNGTFKPSPGMRPPPGGTMPTAPTGSTADPAFSPWETAGAVGKFFGDVFGLIGNTGGAAGAAASAIARFVNWLNLPNLAMRIGTGLLGAILLLFGIMLLGVSK